MAGPPGLDGADGPNLACEGCGRAVATRVDDCRLWQAVWLEPDAVRRVPADGPPAPYDPREAPGWEPFVAPHGAWNPRWRAAVAAAPARLAVVCDGRPVTVVDAAVAELFGRAVDVLFPSSPSGPEPLTLALAGPGWTGTRATAPDLLLVPRDPHTGEAWRPPQPVPVVVPLAAEVWSRLASPPETSPLPASGTLPDGVLRDDYPLPPRPVIPFQPERQVFLRTLARLPAVRRPGPRAVFERAGRYRGAAL
ncbi:hypothetical protein [Streptomyces sp. NPDC005805]|uniref:hypothetical protein n=1 Tax=Streptomyces sp. NPDC005805 TaxID=3157068 RepID=UPI0033CA2F49